MGKTSSNYCCSVYILTLQQLILVDAGEVEIKVNKDMFYRTADVIKTTVFI